MSAFPQAQDPGQLPWDPNCASFPSIRDLPRLPDAPEGAAWVWGEDDQVREIYDTCLKLTTLTSGIAGKAEPPHPTTSQAFSGGDTHGGNDSTGVSKPMRYCLKTYFADFVEPVFP